MTAWAQEPTIRGVSNNLKKVGNIGRQISGGTGTDSLRHRNKLEDSITISFRYLDSARNYKLDSSIVDFTKRFPIPATNIYLGNTGTASESIIFSPVFKVGWDPGFHAFDVYQWPIEKVRFFNTTRPYSELNYFLGSRSEQIIDLLHTQNIKPNWNAMFQYRLINSPGFFKNQKTNDNSYVFSSWYQSVSRRYNNYFVLLANKTQSAEGGGFKNDSDLVNPDFKDRFSIVTRIGGDPAFGRDFFSTVITTGNKYNEFTALLRQQYDLGRKDSVVTDSTVVPLFYPRLRFEHTIQYSKYKYVFQDLPNSGSATFYIPDSAYYQDNYGYTLTRDTIEFKEQWKELINDFSIIQFPDAKNLQQFIKLGASLQNLTGEFTTQSKKYYNAIGHAEYRNKTRNQAWDIEANGKLYFTGLNAGDYNAYISLQRYVGKKLGYILLGFENANRTPSFIFDSHSSFYFLHTVQDFKKENNTQLFASYFLPSFKLRLTGHYYLLTNYTYITDYYQLQQQGSLFNVMDLSLTKTIPLSKHWIWHADVYYQQVIGNSPLHVPTIFTRHQIGYEGNLGFKNLSIAFGAEIRYHSPYKADGYSPVIGQFFSQDSITVKEKMPDISAYMHFRIRSFKAFLRLENLNTASTSDGGFGFTNNNPVAPGYAMPGLQFRFGIYWSFVN